MGQGMKRTFIKIITAIISLNVVNVIYAQTCNDNIKETTPDYRFINNGDGTITDRWTGLMWTQCPEGMTANQTTGGCDGTAIEYSSWQDALNRVQSVNAGSAGNNHGYNDWHLPNIKELVSLTEAKCIDPARNLTIFPVGSGGLWSSTSYATGGISIWTYVLSSGAISTDGATTLSPRKIQLVRGF
jgi:hypothetical protein